MKEYKKLVRDKIPEFVRSDGLTPITRILDDDEYLLELNKKLLEEVNEYLIDSDTSELIDIEEVIRAILDLKGISLEEFEKSRKAKVLKRGAFKERIFLEREE